MHRAARGRVLPTEVELAGRERVEREREREREKIPREIGRDSSQGRRGREDPNPGTTYPAQRQSAQHKTIPNLLPSCIIPLLRRHPNPMTLIFPPIPVTPPPSSASPMNENCRKSRGTRKGIAMVSRTRSSIHRNRGRAGVGLAIRRVGGCRGLGG